MKIVREVFSGITIVRKIRIAFIFLRFVCAYDGKI